MKHDCRALWLALLLPLSSGAAEPVHVVPSMASPLTAGTSFLDRQFSPLDANRLKARLASLGVTDILHIDLGSESLLVRAPAKPAADGRYGVLIYLDPRAQPRLDARWNNALDAHGIVFISPENAGDDASAMDRRIPLALDAYEYARQAYRVDPDRIYIAGISGGARIAEQLAVSYPDIFSAAIVNSGAIELGTQEVPAPSADALTRLRSHSRLVFVTAKLDEPAFTQQRLAVKSLHRYCVPITAVFEPGNIIAGHANIDGLSMSDMLDSIESPKALDTQATPGCEESLRGDAHAAMATIRQLTADGRHDEALKGLVAFDHAYGRLFLEQDLAMAKALEPASPAPAAAPASGAAPTASH